MHGFVWVILFSMAGPTVAADQLTSPYRDQASTEIRALSEKEILELREGRGMGLARAAELNGYPGPRHVLDAAQAGRLHLSADQAQRVRLLFDGMAHEAQRLGGLILREEQGLENEFRAGRIGEADLKTRVDRIATLQGQLRAVHLRAHLGTRSVLSEDQIQHYNELRGYTGAAPHEPQPHERH